MPPQNPMFQMMSTTEDGNFTILTTGPYRHWTDYETQVFKRNKDGTNDYLDLITFKSMDEYGARQDHRLAYAWASKND